MQERIEQLNALIEENPVTIPLPKAAKFMGIAPESLRRCIMQGRCPFALGWSNGHGQDAFSVQTVAFVRWMNGGITQ